jgi:hypothetical protein
MSNKLINKDGNEAVLAAMSKDDFKAMFALFAGRPDSRCKRLNRRIQVDVDSLRHLNEKIHEKLSLHNIESAITTVTIVQKDREALDFGLWNTFVSHDWKTSYQTESVMMKWDFLIKLDSHVSPQRHTLSVKISKGMTPKDMLRTMLLTIDDGDDDGRDEMSLCIVRVDFINHSLADELIHVVEKWNASVRQCKAVGGVSKWANKHDDKIARIIHWSISLFMVLLVICIVGNFEYSSDGMPLLAQTIIGGIAIIQMAYVASRFLAAKAYSAINESAEYYPFSLSNGDKNAIADAEKKASKAIRTFMITAGTAIVINLISAVLAVWIGIGTHTP